MTGNRFNTYSQQYEPYSTVDLPQQQTQQDPLQDYQMPMEDTVTKWQLDNSDILTKIEYQLRGFRQVQNQWIKPPSKDFQLLNEMGIAGIMQLVQSAFNKIMNCTNFTEEETNQIGIFFSESLIDLITFNYNKYNIKTPQDCEMIKTIIIMPFKGILNQSRNDGTRRYLKSIIGYKESFVNQDMDGMPIMRGQQRKKGFSLFG